MHVAADDNGGPPAAKLMPDHLFFLQNDPFRRVGPPCGNCSAPRIQNGGAFTAGTPKCGATFPAVAVASAVHFNPCHPFRQGAMSFVRELSALFGSLRAGPWRIRLDDLLASGLQVHDAP